MSFHDVDHNGIGLGHAIRPPNFIFTEPLTAPFSLSQKTLKVRSEYHEIHSSIIVGYLHCYEFPGASVVK